jgi:hypothetical protein
VHISQIIRLPTGRVNPSGAAHQYTGDVIVRHRRIFIPEKLAGRLLVIQQPGETPWMRQWICNYAGRVLVCL